MIEEETKKGMSTGAKWGVGCGIGCLTLIILAAVLAFMGIRFAKDKLSEMTDDLKQYGFEQVEQGQTIEVQKDITEPIIYMGQMVKIMGNCSTNLAIVAQMAEIHGTVEGKVYFRGQMLTIQPQAKLMNGLDATAQLVQRYGKINGPVTGAHQMVESSEEQ